MVSRFNKSTLGDDWFKTFSAFRLNSESFLDRRKLTRDAFCLDVLKDLYLDHVEIQTKIHLLLLLQEFSAQLIVDINLLEQVIASLSNLFNVLGNKSEKRLLKSQILISIVTILLSLDLSQDISRFVMKVKILLLETIYSKSDDPVVVSSACNCLEELETFYPGILESEIENISLACERETSSAFQSYALLLSTCAKLSTISIKNLREQRENENLGSGDSKIFPGISNVLELVPLMSYTTQYRVLKDLITVVKNSSELSPKTFMLYFNNLLMSSEVPLFHLAFDLQEAFGSDLLSAQEEKQLLKQLIRLSTHPCLTSSHRLIFLDWLKCYVKYNKITLSTISLSDLELLLPSPFDGPLTQEKKAYILVLCIPPKLDERLCGDFLNETVSGLIKCSLLSGGTKAAPSLFRTLYVYFSSQTSETVNESIYKLLTGMMKTSLHLTPYALSFLHSVKSKYSERKFHDKALDHMVQHILSVPIKQANLNLVYYLAILESAAQECTAVCRPRAILRLLQKLFNNANLNLKNAWCIGNSILSLCRSLMKYHDVQIFYYDLAEVLCLITQHFKDADVKDRAKIYYSMLTSLSSFKVQKIFNLHSSEKEGKSALNSFVTGGDSLQFATCVQKLSKPILQLIRTEQRNHQTKCEISQSFEPIQDILKIYQQHTTLHESFLQIPFIIKHVSGVENSFSELYCIVITTQSEPACKEISVIEIPVLKEHPLPTSQEKVVSLKLVPLEPNPMTLHFKAEFTSSNGYSYTCHPPSLILHLEDLFLPLPVPESHSHCESSWRQVLFEALWERFVNNMNLREKECNCCQSVFALKLKKEDFSSFVEKKWQRFIVSRPSPLEYHIAIYLSPLSHLLLKICIANDKPFVNIVVDNNATLPWISLYLQNINESTDIDEGIDV